MAPSSELSAVCGTCALGVLLPDENCRCWYPWPMRAEKIRAVDEFLGRRRHMNTVQGIEI